MLMDRFRKKTKGPNGSGGSSLGTVDISDQVPEVDDVLADVDKALKKATELEKQLKPQQRGCGCGG